MFNKHFQGTDKTLVDAKAKIFCFISFIKLCQKHISDKNFYQFYWLKKNVRRLMLLWVVILDHLKILASDLKERFSYLKQIYFSTWVMQPMLVDLSDA